MGNFAENLNLGNRFRPPASQPWSSRDSTLAANNMYLSFLGKVDFQTLWSLLHDLHAAALRTSIPFLKTPRYLKSATFSSVVPSIVWMSVLLWLKDMYLVLSAFILSPTFPTDVSTLLNSSWTCSIFSDSRAISSAKSKFVMTSGPIRLLLRF